MPSPYSTAWSSGYSSGYGGAPAWGGRLGVDVYAAGVRVGSAPFANVLTASRTRRVNAIGDYIFTIPAMDANQVEIVQGREIRMFREGDGELWRGVVESAKRIIVPTGEHVLEVSGRTLAAELAYENIYAGVRYDSSVMADIVDDLVALVDWTAVLESGLPDVTTAYDWLSVWQTLFNLATIASGYVRETANPREVEIKTANADSGLRLFGVENIDPVGILQASNVGLISGIPMVQEDGAAIINRVVPFGSPDGEIPFDIRNSDRTSPYTIQHTTPTPARLNAYDLQEQIDASVPIGNRTAFFGIGGSGTNAVTEGGEVGDSFMDSPGLRGRNRLLLIFISMHADSNVNNDAASAVYFAGKSGTLLADYAITKSRVQVWGIPNPPLYAKNTLYRNQISFNFDASFTCYYNISSIYLEDVDLAQFDDFGTFIDHNAGGGTSGSMSISSDANSVVIGLAMNGNTNEAVTLDGNGIETRWGAFHVQSGAMSWKPGAASVSFAASWTTSVDWIMFAISIPGARNYYIEDSTSVTAYGRRTQPLFLNDFKNNAGIGYLGALEDVAIASANALYDAAATQLARMAALPVNYDVDVVGLPLAGWLPGDTMRTVYRGVATDLQGTRVYLDVDDDLIVLEATDSYDGSGARQWKLKFSPVLRYVPTTPRALAATSRDVQGLNAR